MNKIFWLFLFTILVYSTQANSAADPCSGPQALLNIVNRPTFSESACTVPAKNLFIETGFQYEENTGKMGTQHNFPNAVLRLGLPAKNEVLVLLPNYYHQAQAPKQGLGATTFGAKHQLVSNEKWIVAAEALIISASGSDAFGSAGTGTAIEAIVSYTLNDKLSLLTMITGSTQTTSKLGGAERYASMSPDFVLTYSAQDKLNLYVEVYGQSRVNPYQSWGWDTDFGLLYLLNSAVVVDLEMGKRLRGELGSFEQYVGAGISFMLD